MFIQFPYTDLYNLNLDWIIKAIKEVQEIIGDLGSVVNSVNGMTGDVELTSEIINSIIGGVVNSFNGRAGNVSLTPQDVNDTLIDITYTSDPGETISDYTQEDLNQFYSNGVRVLIMVNSQGQPDRLYFLTMVGDDATPQQYTPTGAIAGVSSYNGQTGDVTGVSSFNGQSGAVTGVASFNGQGGAVTGVNSVNGATGAVSLNAQNLPIAEGQTSTIAAALAGKQPVLTFDSSPTAGSSNPVTSAGIATALEGKQPLLTFDTTPTLNSNNPVTSGGVAFELARKQNTLTFDSTPTANSTNPVTSGGLYTELSAITNKLTFYLNYMGINPANWNSLFTGNEKCIDVYIISTSSLPAGAPSDAYGYGLLLVIKTDFSRSWADIMIYIPDSSSTNNIYIKTKGTTEWNRLTGVKVTDKT